MKKIDLHIHTIANNFLDAPFLYDSEIMKAYVCDNGLDIIAITNHNLFDFKNFQLIKNDLSNVKVKIFPGIEISLENGHVLVIGDDTNDTYGILNAISTEIAKFEHSDKYKMSILDFNRLCSNKKLLIIPHYKKDPVLGQEYIDNINDKILIGEVGSPKAFFGMKKKGDLVPVYFSDIRIGREDIEKNIISSRFTYLDCNSSDFATVKRSLEDKRYVDLNKEGLEEEFEILDGISRASTGINVLVGKRSSGKTYTLENINSTNLNNSLYIKQFEITQDCKDDEFAKKIKNDEQQMVSDYFKEFVEVLDYIDELSINDSIDEYIKTLKLYAQQSINDLYSKLSLFNYLEIDCEDINEPCKIIKAIETLLDSSDKYSCDIFSTLEREKLIYLYRFILTKYKLLHKHNKCVEISNNITKDISEALGSKTSVVQVKNSDLKECFKILYIKKKFNLLVASIVRKKIYKEKILDKFTKEVEVAKHTNKNKMKSCLGVGKNGTVDYLIEKCPFDAYLEAKNDNNISNKIGVTRYKLFFDYEVQILNETGNSISGGQKAEYMLLNKLVNYKMFDFVLLDEMEASFDNPFLNKEIIDLLKIISKKCTVFISTHNNNLGVSLNPDYYIYHSVVNNDGHYAYVRYYGKSNEEYLVDCDNNSIKLSDVLIKTMEASETAYKERGNRYESFTHNE